MGKITTQEFDDNLKENINAIQSQRKSGDVFKALKATDANSEYGAGYNFSKLNNELHSLVSGDLSRNTSWLGNKSDLPVWVEMDVPFGVVIGDSISEGHPMLHGRLHPSGSNGFDADYPNQSGQLSYELGQITGLYFYNHGIGGQTSTQVWNRWRRDVLAENYDPNDGRGAKTLDEKPHCVFIVVGINDIFIGVDPKETRQNMVNMAKSARDNGVIAVFLNAGAHNAATAEQNKAISDLNKWMSEKLPVFGAQVVDFHRWSLDTDGSGVNGVFFADNVHPSSGGYKVLARYILDQVNELPVFFNGLLLESQLDPQNTPNRMARATNVTITIGSNSVNRILKPVESVFCPVHSDGTSRKMKIQINEIAIVTGVGLYVGFSKVKALLSTSPSIATQEKASTSLRIRRSENFTVTNSSEWTNVPMDQVVSDHIGMFDPVSAEITVKEEGLYMVGASALWSSVIETEFTSRAIRISKVDSLDVKRVIAKDIRSETPDDYTGVYNNCQGFFRLYAGEKILLESWHNSANAGGVQMLAVAYESIELYLVKV